MWLLLALLLVGQLCFLYPLFSGFYGFSESAGAGAVMVAESPLSSEAPRRPIGRYIVKTVPSSAELLDGEFAIYEGDDEIAV